MSHARPRSGSQASNEANNHLAYTTSLPIAYRLHIEMFRPAVYHTAMKQRRGLLGVDFSPSGHRSGTGTAQPEMSILGLYKSSSGYSP